MKALSPEQKVQVGGVLKLLLDDIRRVQSSKSQDKPDVAPVGPLDKGPESIQTLRMGATSPVPPDLSLLAKRFVEEFMAWAKQSDADKGEKKDGEGISGADS